MFPLKSTATLTQHIDSITIELDESHEYGPYPHEISYSEDYLTFNLEVYQKVDIIKGNYFVPDNTHIRTTTISIHNLIRTDHDGSVILMSDDAKRRIEREIENALKII
ncbi:MAG: hypothetical protein AAF348_11590 [Bacteroidota bacterium]